LDNYCQRFFITIQTKIFIQHNHKLVETFHVVSECNKALHSELLAELSGRFPSRNEYFRISELRIVSNFFEGFGKFGKFTLPKPRKKFGNIRE